MSEKKKIESAAPPPERNEEKKPKPGKLAWDGRAWTAPMKKPSGKE